jgi:hypothetical protein
MVEFNFEREFNTIAGSRLNKKMGQYCLNLFLKNFTKEGYLNGQGSFLKWKSLSLAYDISKSKSKPGYPIGFVTGKLKSSFNIKYKSNGFEINNNSEHAEYFHKERPILYQDSSIDNEMIGYIDEEVQKIFKNLKNKLNP